MGLRNRGAELCSAKLFPCVLAYVLSFLLLFFCDSGRGQENRKLIKKVDPVYPDSRER